MNDKISLRFAKEDDFKDVLEISEGVYDGRDYLPHEFHCLLKTTNKLVFLAEVQGKVIGLQVVDIVDDGHTFVIKALRIHKDFRGRGYSYKITSAIMNRVYV
jgi:ribosomal protein S18 acetylase RimI-like enzyme